MNVLKDRRGLIISCTLLAPVVLAGWWLWLRVPGPTAGAKPSTAPAPAAPAHAAPVVSPDDAVPAKPETPALRRLVLSTKELEKFLAKHRRNGPSLIAAYSLTNDLRYLKEAVIQAPELPQVALAALAMGTEGDDAVWIKALVAADPANPLVQYLATLEALRRQDGQAAFFALELAQGLPDWDDYSASRLQLVEEAARDAGFSPEAAAALAAKSSEPADMLLPKYLELADLLGSHLSNYRHQTAEVDWMVQAALKLGQELKRDLPGRSLYLQAGGALFQESIYQGLQQLDPFPSLKETPQQLAAAATEYKQWLIHLRQEFNTANWHEPEGGPEEVGFYQKKRTEGEVAALLWALARKDP